MPTDYGDGESPTSNANATALDMSSISPEQIESHPHVQELKKKYAAAHSKMDATQLSHKQLEAELAKYKTLAGVEELEEEEVTPSYITKAELTSTLWEDRNAKDIELYADDDYKIELDRGVPRDIALKYAKQRHQKSPNSAQVQRQQAMASGSSTSTRELTDIDVTDEDRVNMKLWNYSEKTLLKQKALKRSRGQ